MKNKYCTFYVVRHGETEWNVKKLMQGHSNSPLTTNGIKQARETAKKMRNIHFDEVFSSDLERAKQTAEIIALEKKLAVKTTQLLREKNLGHYEGKKYTIFQTELKKYLEEFESLNEDSKKKYRYPTMESDEDVVTRFITFIREIAVAYPDKTVLLTTHAGVIGNFLIHLGLWTYKDQFKKKVKNGGFLKFKSDGIDFFMLESKGIEVEIPNKLRSN